MNAKIKSEFKKYLYTVCQDEVFRKCALKFFDNLSKTLEGIKFTPNDFETLIIDGVETQQDVVKAVFKDKSTATAEEIFLFLFKQNVKEIGWYTTNKEEKDNYTGYFSFDEQNIKIKNCTPNEFYRPMSFVAQPVSITPGMTDRKYKRLKMKKERIADMKSKEYQKKESRRANRAYLAHISHVIHHEMSHVFEVKSFLNRGYIKKDLSNWIFINNDNELMACPTDEINDQKRDLVRKKYLRIKDTEYLYSDIYYEAVMSAGSTAISEVLNEEFASLLDHSLVVGYRPMRMSDDYESKTMQMSPCGYNYNYDIDSLLHLAIGDFSVKDFRFNSKKIIESINNLSIPSCKDCEDKLIDLVHPFFLANVSEEFADEIVKQIKSSDQYTLLCFIMGMAERIGELNKNGNTSQLVSDYKLIAQEMLIDAINTNTQQNFEPTKDYLKSLNDTLTTIDDVIAYPTTGTIFHVEDDDPSNKSGEKEIRKVNTDICSVDRFCKKYPNLTHLQKFNELIKYVESRMKYAKVENLDEIMDFFTKQKKLDARFKNYATKADSLKQKKEKEREGLEREEARKREEEARKREKRLKKEEAKREAFNQVLSKPHNEQTEEDRRLIREFLLNQNQDLNNII